MKTLRRPRLEIRRWKFSPIGTALLVAFTVITSSPRALGQSETVTISAAEFQRMVYSAHLLTQLAEKPELDASLQVLLELQRRNPQADLIALSGMLREATARYRTNAPTYIRAHGSRDEVLAAYLDALRHVPARTNFGPADLVLLNTFMLQREDYATASAAELIHAGNQRLLAFEGDLTKRQALLDTCVGRAHGHAVFRDAMDEMLWPETLMSVGNSPAEIIGNTNSPLHDNSTMQTLLTLMNGDGSLTVSSNQLMNLFSGETQTFWDTINTNLAVQLEINRSHPDLLAYLTNQPAIDANAQRLTAVKQGQARRIASATAAVLVQSKLMEAKEPLIKLPGQMQGVLEGLHKITDGLAAFGGTDVTKLTRIAGCGNMLAGGLQLLNLFTGGESAEDEIAREIGNIKTLLGDLSTNMNYRFDRVDQSLTTIFDTLNERFDQVEMTLDEQGRQIAHLNGDVDEIRSSLVDVQTDVHRLERHLLAYVNQLYARGLDQDFNKYLGYESTYPDDPMEPSEYNNTENHFFTHARNNSVDGLSSPYSGRVYSPEGLYWELTEGGGGTTNRLDQNLSYIKKYLNDVLGQATAGPLPLANPRDWFVGAYAYQQLAVENPMFFRAVNISNRLDLITARGREITSFLGSLTFASGTNINWSLFAALENYYAGKLPAFTSQVGPLEQQYAATTNFALDTWRPWAVAAPRVAAATTAVLVSPSSRNIIAAGGYHSLVVKPDGRVVGWGDNAHGQTTIPASATNVMTVAAGGNHSLAVKANRTVVAWGDNTYGQVTIPASASNVIAVSAGHLHSLALRGDGTVVAWGAGTNSGSFPHFEQSLVPSDATNITAIAGGGYHSLALRADGTLLAWGLNNEGQLDIPASATNVIAIASGHGHNLALKADGTLIAWGNNFYGSTDLPATATNIIAIASAGWHCLAQRADGAVLSWGRNDLGQTVVSPSLGNVHSLAAGLLHSLALKADGSVVGWGSDEQHQAIARGWLASPRVRTHIAAGYRHSIAVKADGTAIGWGNNDYGQTNVPSWLNNAVAVSAGENWGVALTSDGRVVAWGYRPGGGSYPPSNWTNVVAIEAGWEHCLALQPNGTVLGWGHNQFGQATGIPNAVYPYYSDGVVTLGGQTLTNVVAISGGDQFSLALRADGTVVGWGKNYYDQITIPDSATNVVAIGAGFIHSIALKGDGTVVAWGNGEYGQTWVPAMATNVVAITAGGWHNLALRVDGTVVGWGENRNAQATGVQYGQPGLVTIGGHILSNVVAIAGGDFFHSLAIRADGTVVGWGDNGYGQTAVPATMIDLAAWGDYPPNLPNFPVTSSPIVAVTAGAAHNLALTTSGSVVGWGLNTWGQTNVPPQAQSGIRAVASGLGHNVALANNGSVLAWGLNDFGQANVPVSAQSGVLAIGAGSKHNLALKTNGTVIGWGYNAFGQTTIPASATNVVTIAAGCAHSLALKANGAVVAWGGNSWGQTNLPLEATNGVVAIAAGRYHNLALTSAGRVLAWGWNSSGQTNVPLQAQSGVVAIAAGITHSVALKADGTVVVWGSGPPAFSPPQPWANVVAIAAGDLHSVLLRANTSPGNSVQTFSLARAQIPARVAHLFSGANDYIIAEIGRVGTFQAAATELSGAKALLTAVLELGLPYTLERDDVLRGFLYGSESLVDLDASRTFAGIENAKMIADPGTAPQLLTEVAALRFQRFNERLEARLNDLAANGEPEPPRMIGQTLRQLYVLRDAWNAVPPPALELGRESNALRLGLYGEPYARYTLQYRDDLTVPGWFTTTITNLHNEEVITPLTNATQRFYRAVLPVP